ncbi:hypothetical protein ECG_00906 [Echinococcus granulosus]|uniref:Transforming acidic coiled coil containing n=1 Tax=Echinococcus granulosus TaxID=6210 RepID=A0A068W992_ECHGR|nr:hypothetical protein ECG_00906 [Echinococcus granulosus]CDS16208.1 transforming acidic coiled coil containing [Echinococcus granulosus]
MSDRPKSTQLTPEEIDRLLADSLLSLHCADDPAVSKPLWVAPESTLTEADLALLDETGMCEQPSSVAIEKGHNEDVIQEATQALSSQNERIPAAMDKIPPDHFEADFTASASPTDQFSLSASVSSPLPIRENPGHPGFSTQKRNSFSKLVHGWTTLMGHPIAGSISSQLTTSPQSVSIFSPLLTQSSKLLTGVVSSLLSPWALASRQIAEISEHSFDGVGLVQDRPCEDSLINAFEKIGIADSYSEHDDVFFSPNHDRDETKGARNTSISPLPVVRLRSAMMEDTQCGPNTESSVYSDAVSVPLSPRRSMPPSPHRSSTHLENLDAVSSSHSRLLSEVEGFPPSQFGHCPPQLVNADLTSSFSLNKTTAEEEASKINKNLLPGVNSSPKREIFPRGVFSAEPEISEDTFACSASREAFGDFTVDVVLPKLEANTSTKSSAVYPEGPGQPDTELTPQSFFKPRVSCSPFPMMISVMSDNEEWNTTQKSTGRSSIPINSRRNSKSTVYGRKAKPQDELVSRAVESSIKGLSHEGSEVSHRSSKRCEMATFEQLSPQLSSSTLFSTSENSSHCSISSRPSSEHLSAASGMLQPPPRKAANSVTFTESEQDKENVSPDVSVIVTRRRAIHRLPVLPVPTGPVPAPRHSAHKAKTQLAFPTGRGEIVEAKAQLRREIKALKAKEDILWLVLIKYGTAFEEALDQRSQVHFAAASARAQASNEVSETRRQTATLYNAVLESQRRHERMRETIEKAEASQDEWLKRIEALQTKHTRQSEKGVTYQKYCLGKIQRALENQEVTKTEMEKELSKLRVQSKQMEMKQRSLEAELKQKAQENQELTRICDSLLT